jgi:hypothetical protein
MGYVFGEDGRRHRVFSLPSTYRLFSALIRRTLTPEVVMSELAEALRNPDPQVREKALYTALADTSTHEKETIHSLITDLLDRTNPRNLRELASISTRA